LHPKKIQTKMNRIDRIKSRKTKIGFEI